MLPARSPPPSEDPRYLGTPASMGFARSTAAGIGFSHQRGSAHLDTRRQRTTHRRQPHHTTCEARRTSASSRTLNALRLHTTPLEMLPTTFLSRLSRDSPRIPCGVTAGSVMTSSRRGTPSFSLAYPTWNGYLSPKPFRRSGENG